MAGRAASTPADHQQTTDADTPAARSGANDSLYRTPAAGRAACPCRREWHRTANAPPVWGTSPQGFRTLATRHSLMSTNSCCMVIFYGKLRGREHAVVYILPLQPNSGIAHVSSLIRSGDGFLSFDRSLLIDVKLVTVCDMSDTPKVLLQEPPRQKRRWVRFDLSGPSSWRQGIRTAEQHAATAMRFSRRLTAIAVRELERLLVIISTVDRRSSVRRPRLKYIIEPRPTSAIEQLIQLPLRLGHKGNRLEARSLQADAVSPHCSATARHTLKLRRAVARSRENKRSWRLKPTLWMFLGVLIDIVTSAPHFRSTAASREQHNARLRPPPVADDTSKRDTR